MPDGWIPEWAGSDKGRGEWERDYPDAASREEHYRTYAVDGWYDLPVAEQWQQAMGGLRADRPWAQLAPDNLATITFGPGVTVYDVLAPDRDDRVRVAFDQDDVE